MAGEQLQQTEQERSILSGALSMEFSDCSIAAAALSKQACEQIAARNEVGEFHIIGDDHIPERLAHTPISDCDSRSFTLDGYYATVGLFQPTESVEKPGSHKEKRRWLPDKVVEYTYVDDVLTGDPYLGIYAGHDTILPLVSFARRKEGQCSYVQLGQEMYDDNFYSTQADDESSRHELVEALRQLCSVTNTWFNLRKERPKEVALIQNFINTQAFTHEALVVAAYERQIARLCREKVRSQKSNKRSLQLIDSESSSIIPQSYNTVTLAPPSLLPDGRKASLMAAQREGDDGRIQLLAVTRNKVAASLATIPEHYDSIELDDSVNLNGAEKRQIMRHMLHYARGARPVHSAGDFKPTYETNQLEHIDQQIAEYCFNRGFLGKYERWSNGGSRRQRNEVAVVGDVTSNKLDDFFAYPTEERLPFDSAPLGLAFSRLEYRMKEISDLLKNLSAPRLFEQSLGEVRVCDELLMHYVGQLQDGSSVVFNNLQMGKTREHALISANITRNDGNIEIAIKGRPVSMPDEPLKKLIDFTLDPTRPYLGQERHTESFFSDENTMELVGILRRIVHANRKSGSKN